MLYLPLQLLSTQYSHRDCDPFSLSLSLCKKCTKFDYYEIDCIMDPFPYIKLHDVKYFLNILYSRFWHDIAYEPYDIAYDFVGVSRSSKYLFDHLS